MRFLDPERLFKWYRVNYPLVGDHHDDETFKRGYTDRDLARHAGSSRSAISRWRRCGRIELGVADRVANNLGAHIIDIWPTAYDDLRGDAA